MRKVLAILMSLWVVPAFSADNAVTLTTGSGVTMRTIDIGAGVQSSVVILGSSAGAAIYGTAGTANANVITVQGIASGTNLPVTVANANANGQATMANSSPIVIASNQTANALWGQAATGGAVPANAQYLGVNVGGNLTGFAPGTAGTASTQVISVQGIASMTKLLVTPDANSAVNVAQINGVTPLMGNGVTGTGSPRVTLVSDGTAISTTGYMSVKVDQTTPGTTNSVSFGTDPCSFLAKTNLAIDQAADTQIISGTSAKKTYICSISIIAAVADTVSVVAGTGTVCATNIAALIGSTTDANGLSFAANGGLTLGNGMATIASGATNADNICIRQGGTSRIAGNLTYVQN